MRSAARPGKLGDHGGPVRAQGRRWSSGRDLALEHPLLSWQIRANYRHHQAHVYVVTPGPVREDKYSVTSVRVGGPAVKNVGDLGTDPRPRRRRDQQRTGQRAGRRSRVSRRTRRSSRYRRAGQATGDPVGACASEQRQRLAGRLLAALERCATS